MPVWQFGTQNDLINFTIRPDGSVVAFETEQGALNAEGNPDTRRFLDVFDGSTGQLTLRIPLQQLVQTHQEPCQPLNYVTLEAGPMSPVIVDGNGNINLEYQTGNSTFVSNSDCQGTRSRTIVNNTNTVLLTVSLDGSVSSQTLRSDTATTFTQETWVYGPGGVVIITSSTTSLSGSSTAPGRVIPDGQGGALATWSEGPNGTVSVSPPMMVTHLSSSGGGTYSLPIVETSQLVVGENGVAFAAQNNTRQKVVSFNISSGQVLWTYEAPAQSIFSIVASAAGNGLVAKLTDSNGVDTVLSLDAAGNATSIAANGRGLSYSWRGDWITLTASGQVSQIVLPVAVNTASVWATPEGNPSENNASDALCDCLAETTNPDPPPPPATCPICNLTPPTQAPTCTSTAGSMSTYLILVGDSSTSPTGDHNVGNLFNLVAQTQANSLQSQGHHVVACRVSTIQHIGQALTASGPIDGGVIYFGHAAFLPRDDIPGAFYSLVAVGQQIGDNWRISYKNVGTLSNSQLGPNATIALNACNAGLSWSPGQPPVAQLIANQLRRNVYAHQVGMYFSQNPNDTHHGGIGKAPSTLPLYMLPEGAVPKPKPIQFSPQ